MYSVKTTLPSIRKIEWRTLKTETNRINQMLPYISTNNISELNDLMYAGAKLGCEKKKRTKKQSKPGCEVRLETQIKNLRKQAQKRKILEYVGRKWKRQHEKKITVQLEEINRKKED